MIGKQQQVRQYIFIVLYIIVLGGLVSFRPLEKKTRDFSFDPDIVKDERAENDIDPISPLGNNTGENPSEIPNGNIPIEMIKPSSSNFELVSAAIAASVNRVNVMQENQTQIDPTDLSENYLDFSEVKYDLVQKGERRYKYLTLQKYWYNSEQKVMASVSIPNTEDGKKAEEYVDRVLNSLKTVDHIDISQVDAEEKRQIARDVDELGRFTCIKFLRLVWSVFNEKSSDTKGLFPQVYQMRVVDAGDLSNMVDGGIDLFSNDSVDVVRGSLVKYANVTNASPERRAKLFNNKIVVFFRPTNKKSRNVDNGHVGVGRMQAQYDRAGNITNFTISYVEVNGFTGQSFSHQHQNLDDFRNRLYSSSLPSKYSMKSHSENTHEIEQVVGWFINREG